MGGTVETSLRILQRAYAAGDHGFGVRKTSLPVSTWGDRCIDWLRNLGMLTPRK